MTSTICIAGQCVNQCLTPIFDGSTTYKIFTLPPPITIALDSVTDYILEADAEYLQHLHNAYIDLPFCPTREKPPGKREEKLLPTLYDKKCYVIHHCNLQQCTHHGLRITKIVYCNSRNFHDFVSILNSIQILEL